jgi:hypothetical protein
MPNELKNALNASTIHTTSRRLPLAGESTVSVMIWTMSGIVLASCGGGGGGGGGGLSINAPPTPTPSFASVARVIDGPVWGAAVYFDLDGDGVVSPDERRAQRDENGDPHYETDENGEVPIPLQYRGRMFVADVEGAIDTSTGEVLRGDHIPFDIATGVSTPITTLIRGQIGRHGTDNEAQAVLVQIFGSDRSGAPWVTLDEVLNTDNYEIQQTPQTSPPDRTDTNYETLLANYQNYLIYRAALGLTEIEQNDGGRFTALDEPHERIAALRALFTGLPDSHTTALTQQIGVREQKGRAIMDGKPIAAPDPHVNVGNYSNTFTFRDKDRLFGFLDPEGNSPTAARSEFKGIFVNKKIKFDQEDTKDGSGPAELTVDLVYPDPDDTNTGTRQYIPLVDDLGNRPATLPSVDPSVENDFVYVSYENLSSVGITDFFIVWGKFTVEYYVFDGEQWSESALLEVNVHNSNTYSPEITQRATHQVPLLEGRFDEDTDTGLTFRITDRDGGTPIVAVSDDRFEIVNGHLRIKAGSIIDYEALSYGQLTLTIAVMDDGTGINVPSIGLPTSRSIKVTLVFGDVVGNAQFTITSDGDTDAPMPGDVLTAVLSDPDPDYNNPTYSYQWYYADSRLVDVGDYYAYFGSPGFYGLDYDIRGETSQTYTIRASDVGRKIGVRIIYNDDGRTSADSEQGRVELATDVATNSLTTATVTDPSISGVVNIRDIRSVFSFDSQGNGTGSVEETYDILKFTSLEAAVRGYSEINATLNSLSATFGGAVADNDNPHRATVTFNVSGQDDIVFTYVLSGDDVAYVKLVQNGNEVSLVTVAGPDFENPDDEDKMNDYSVAETITTTSTQVSSGNREVSRTYTLTVTDDSDDLSIEVFEHHPSQIPIDIRPGGFVGYQLTDGYGDNPLFTIDAGGHVRWKVVPDFENPLDGDGNNRYGIELFRTVNSQTERVRVDISVKDLSVELDPGEIFDPFVTFRPPDIAKSQLPSNKLVQSLIYGFAWKMPDTGPLVVTYSISEAARADLKVYLSDYYSTSSASETINYYQSSEEDRIAFAKTVTADQARVNNFYTVLEASLSSIEAAANVKFVEVSHPEDNTIHIDLTFGISGYNLSGYTRTDIHRDGADINFGTYAIRTNNSEMTGAITREFVSALALSHPGTSQGIALPPTERARIIEEADLNIFSRDEEVKALAEKLFNLYWPAHSTSSDSYQSVFREHVYNSLQPADIAALQFLYGAPGTNFKGVEYKILESFVRFRFQDGSNPSENTATASVLESDDILKFASLKAVLGKYSEIGVALNAVSATFAGAERIDSRSATITYNVAGQDDIVFNYALTGDDVGYFRLVQHGNDILIVTITGPNFEDPLDEDGMNDYNVVETITTTSTSVPAGHRQVSTTYSLTILDDSSEIDFMVDGAETHIANLTDLGFTSPTISGEDQSHVRVRQTPDGTVLEFTTAPGFGPAKDYDSDDVYELIIIDDNTTVDVDVIIVDI